MSTKPTLSEREMEVLALAWQCMETQPKIDMAKLASLTGYTPGSASVTFGNIKRKLKLLGADVAANGPATPKKTGGPGRGKATTTPKSTAGKRGAEKDEGTPSKKSKKMKDDDDEDEEFSSKGFGGIKKEEVADIRSGADEFYAQAARAAAGYES